MAHEPQLIPDYRLIIQMAIFFATYFVLRALIFKPYLALLAARKAKTTGLKAQATLDKEEALKLQADYDAFIKAERKKLGAWTDEERRSISEEQRGIIQAARDSVGEDLKALRTRIQTDVEKARRELFPLVTEYSSQIASKLVGYRVSVSGNADLGSKSQAEQTVLP